MIFVYMCITKTSNVCTDSSDCDHSTEMFYDIGPKTISSRPSWQKPDTVRMAQEEEEDVDAECEVGSSVLGMSYVSYVSDDSRAPTPAKLSFLNQQTSPVG